MPRFIGSIIFVVLISTSLAGAFAASPVLAVPASKEALHVLIDLPANSESKSGWWLVKIDRPGRPMTMQAVVVAAQVVPGIAADGSVKTGRGRLVANIPPTGDEHGLRRFHLQAATGDSPAPSAFAFTDDKVSTVRLTEHGKPVLAYNYGVITDAKVPKSDNRRRRACYVHPLWGLHGEVLTDDFPKDHYHHHGVFWAWPHVEIGGAAHDLWMYKDIEQRSVARLATDAGPLAAVLGVENGWFVRDKQVMIERVWIEVVKATPTARVIDLYFTYIPVDRPITLRGAEGKSYGGLTIRFAVKDEKQAVITVPGGAAAKDLPETPLPWADMTYPFAGPKQPSGAAIFVPRDHPDYPPTWLTRHYGALCLGWPGVNGKTFQPGEPIRLRYRVWIHANAVETAGLKAAYDAYLAGDAAHWE
jgi:hypothetical protein